MPLKFPNNEDIRLLNSPLHEVICQVRFPAILRILKEDPSEFQEIIRHRFPEISFGQNFAIKIPGIGSTETPAAELEFKIYRFNKPDKATVISLAVDFYALSTTQYEHWHTFKNDLKLAHEATSQVYSPAYGTRIGLRYVNKFTKKNTGSVSFENVVDLFHPDLTVLYRNKVWDNPSEYLIQLVLKDNGAKLTLRTGYAAEKDEPFFLLDFDYFEEGKLDFADLINRIDCFHDVIYDAFRWCLKDESIIHFNPVKKEP